MRRGVMQGLEDVSPLVASVSGLAEAAGSFRIPISECCLLESQADGFVAASALNPDTSALHRAHRRAATIPGRRLGLCGLDRALGVDRYLHQHFQRLVPAGRA